MFVADKERFDLCEIDERVDQIECELALVAPLVHERARLLRARAAILGEPSPATRGRSRITREDVFAYLIRNPGSRAGQIAVGLGAGRPAVSAHLQRGKGKMFSTQAGSWYPIPAADRGVATLASAA